jgi:methoxymalonate biosynthesis acyl carrier protein
MNTAVERVAPEMPTGESVEENLLLFLKERARASVAADVDLFASGLVSSLFALQLVVHVESAFGVSVTGADLKLDNFRTVRAMAELVLRLRGQRNV